MAFKPSVKTEDLRQTLQDITDLLMTMRRQQMEQEAYGLVTRMALGALLRAATPEARDAVRARLTDAASMLGDIPAESPLGRAVTEEAARLAAAIPAE
ncbi:hypothetical protein [Falsiroseomonas sp. HW251]|uniref:hypothetical protein n=1 Tax=Falsiroseomonas sp. HW251 TaxID=3390998 RepID=UPI003D31738E